MKRWSGSGFPWIAALLLAGAVVYLPALGGVFTFDDYQWILHNPHVGDLSSYGWQRRPLTLLTFAANLYVNGPNPVGFHVVNIALHVANSLLVFQVLRRAVPHAARNPGFAAVGAALFLLHPAQTGAVTYISGRPTSLMTFWLLVAHLAALRSQEGGTRRWRAASVATFALAVGSKETALAYPAIWIAWLVFGKGMAVRRSMKAALPHLLASGLLLAAMMLHPGYRSLLAEAAEAGGLATTPLSQAEQRLGLGLCFNDGRPRVDSCVARRVEGVAGLARFLILPWTISIDPGRREIGATDAALVALAGLAAWSALRSRPAVVAAGAAWSIAALLPTHLLLVRSDPVSDRLLYLPMVGLAVVAAAVAGRVSREAVRPGAALAGCAVLFVLALLSWGRNVQYGSEVALWEDAVRKNVSNPRAHVNLGYAYELRGDLDRAESEYRAALRLWPGLRWAEEGLRWVRLRREGGARP